MKEQKETTKSNSKENPNSPPKSARKLGKFNTLILWINLLICLPLLLSYLSPFVPPKSLWLFGLLGLSYPIWLLLNLVFIFYWLLQLKKTAIISTLVVLLGIKQHFSYLQFNTQEKNTIKSDIKIMSYNCMLFDLYTWNPKQSSRNKIFDLLEKEKPDILCLQEFYNSEEAKDFNNIDSLKKIFQDYFVHVEYSHTIRKNDHWGMITLSKFPILNRGKIDFKTKWNNLCIYTDVLIDSDTIRIYNTHLASIHFGKKEHSFLNNLMGDSNTDQLEESKGIIRLLKQGFQRRVGQVNLIDKNKSQCKYPMVICGDFNDPPASYAYKKLQQNLKDAFLECGSGIGSTYSGKLPTFRIDYILFDPMFECINYQEVKVSYTDHFPVITYLRKIKG